MYTSKRYKLASNKLQENTIKQKLELKTKKLLVPKPSPYPNQQHIHNRHHLRDNKRSVQFHTISILFLLIRYLNFVSTYLLLDLTVHGSSKLFRIY